MNNRIDRVNSLLKREISKILLRDFVFFDNAMVTLTRVQTTPNLIEAKAYVSVYPDDKNEKIVENLNKNIFDIQQKINKALRMRPIPKIAFIKDENVQKAGRVEEILEQLKNKEK